MNQSQQKCARTVCNNSPAICKHTDYLGRMYCVPCARKINDAAGKTIVIIPENWLELIRPPKIEVDIP